MCVCPAVYNKTMPLGYQCQIWQSHRKDWSSQSTQNQVLPQGLPTEGSPINILQKKSFAPQKIVSQKEKKVFKKNSFDRK